MHFEETKIGPPTRRIREVMVKNLQENLRNLIIVRIQVTRQDAIEEIV